MQHEAHHHPIHGILTILILGFMIFRFTLGLSLVEAATSIINIQILDGTVTITSPNTLSFSEPIITSFSTQMLTQEFTGSSNYFTVWDTKGVDAGWSTTLQLSGNLTAGAYSIPAGSVEFRSSSGGVVVLSGSYNPNVLMAGSALSFQPLSTARTFIYRDAAVNSGVIGKYGQNIWLNINVPANQPAGSYVGTLIFTLIEN